MKNFIPVILFFISLYGSIYAQRLPELAPLNPDFVNFMSKADSIENTVPVDNEFGTGGIPPPATVSFNGYSKKEGLKATTFAARYDMRELIPAMLTPVKGQTASGCWAFASIGAVESQWLKLGLGAYDLSENNLKYCHGFDASRNGYGNHYMTTAYFARRSGPLTEADDPNANFSTCPGGKTPLAYITDARYLPHDANIIKQAILDHGAIYTMMYISNTYYNATNYTYYYNGTSMVNHAVDLVGWDDTKVTAGGTGAWICKNSYGTAWGENGYFYISYNDKSVLDYNAYWPTRMDYAPDAKVYGYDNLGNYDSFGYSDPVGYFLVKFVGSGSQLLGKVSTYAMAAGTEMEIDVFDTFNPTTLQLSDPLSHQGGLLCPQPGYYTFDLSSPVTIQQNNDFYIRIRYRTPQYNFPLPIEMTIPGYSYPAIESNVTWVSGTGDDGSWFLIGNTTDYKYDACIKAYTEPITTWTGTESSDWNTAGNWSTGAVPTATKNVQIPAVSRLPVINQDVSNPAECNHLNIETSGSLTLAPGKALTVNGILTNNAGSSGLVINSGASLITRGNINGSATVKRSISGNRWHFISSPVSNAMSGIFTGKYLQQHTESTNAYTDITSVAEALYPAKGYALWGDNAGFTSQFPGLLNTGNQTATVFRSATGDNSGWNLVGNPYPSAIDWDAASGWTKTNLGNAIYIESNGDFATYIDGAGTNNGSRYIAPAQGFFVNVINAGPAVLAMTNDVRVHQTSDFFKSVEAAPLLKLRVSGNGFADEAVVRFIPEATDGFDPMYDAYKMFGYNDGSAQLYTLAGVPLAINTLQPGTAEVPLCIHANTSGNYTLAATSLSELGDVTLEDTKTGIFTALQAQPYTFAFSAGEAEQRFILHFGTTLNVVKPENTSLLVNCINQTLYIRLNTTGKVEIAVYSINSQLAAALSSVQGTAEIKLPEPGMYIVKAVTPQRTLIRKVMVF